MPAQIPLLPGMRRVSVDVNDPVKKGQVLVELDTAKLSSQIQR